MSFIYFINFEAETQKEKVKQSIILKALKIKKKLASKNFTVLNMVDNLYSSLVINTATHNIVYKYAV